MQSCYNIIDCIEISILDLQIFSVVGLGRLDLRIKVNPLGLTGSWNAVLMLLLKEFKDVQPPKNSIPEFDNKICGDFNLSCQDSILIKYSICLAHWDYGQIKVPIIVCIDLLGEFFCIILKPREPIF